MGDINYALVTGGSRGIGKAIALRLAKENIRVAFTYNQSVERAKNVLSEMHSISDLNHLSIKTDISNSEEILDLSKVLNDQFGKLHILVNNAGWTEFINHKKLKELTVDIFDKIFQIHLRGSFLCIMEMEKLLKNSEEALIINMASIAANSGVGSNIAYCAIKAGMINMTKSLARSLAPKIRVNAISPGLTDTDLTKGWDSYRSEQIKKTPLGRLGTCDDIANTVWSLFSEMKYVTGQNIIVDGGRLLN